MAEIHQTTMAPTKLELLAAWLPRQPWYVGSGDTSQLDRSGGFRLDDPAGHVGLELLVVTDGSGAAPVRYHVPMSYRSGPLDGAEAGLIGTSEHGVLGTRWLYDGPHDPVLVGAVLAFLRGEIVAQHQTRSDTLDPSFLAHLEPAGIVATDDAVESSADGTDVRAHGDAGEPYVVRFVRRLGEAQDLVLVGAVTGAATGAMVLVHG